MKKCLFALSLILCAVQLIFAQCDREIAYSDYLTNYEGSNFDNNDIGWTGSVSSCNPGTVSQLVQDRILQRINYFRRMCNLGDNTTLSSSLNAAAQESALLMDANNNLSHCTGPNGSPCDTWTCTTPTAITASSQSNLAFGSWDFFNPITNYIEDAGNGNEPVGHRRWILYTGAEEFGSGLTPTTQSLYCLNNFGKPSNAELDYVAYPPNGYIPANLVFPRWSFGMRNSNFTNASVTMTDPNGVNVPLNIIYNQTVGFGDVSIVWEPSGVDLSSMEDLTYTITVSGISGSVPQSSYTYETTIMQLVHPPECPAQTTWSDLDCACTNGSSSGSGTRVKVEVALEAPLMSNGNMSSNLASSGLLPSAQPYSQSPFSYAGSESVNNFPANTVDWVLVELRDSNNTNTVLHRKAALLRSDGVIMDLDGTEGVNFDSAPAGNYFVSINHRNHLGIMSSGPVSLPNSNALDLMASASAVTGTQQLVSNNGTFAMKSGDIDGNGTANFLDFLRWFGENNALNAYKNEDIDMNGTTNFLDFLQWFGNNNSLAIQQLQY